MKTHAKLLRGMTAAGLGLCLTTSPSQAAERGDERPALEAVSTLAQVAPGPGSLALLAAAGASAAGRRRRSI